VQVQQVAVVDGDLLAWKGVESVSAASPATAPSKRDPRSYTPKHLAKRILTSRSALEGERKQVTILFADVKGSTELASELDPEGRPGTI
jgi:class 3 adenylate cyclase